MLRSALALALGLPALVLGCAAESAGPDTDLLPSGKGDDLNVATVSTDEVLEFETLQRIACEAVALEGELPSLEAREAVIDQCGDFEFTIVGKNQSTLYQHTNSRRPVTLSMKVALDSPDSSHESILFRVFGDENRFVWRGTVGGGLSDAEYLAVLAAAAGPELAPKRQAWDTKVRTAELDELPHGVVRQFEEFAAGAEASPDGAPSRLFRSDRVVGYGFPVEVDGQAGAIVIDSKGTVVSALPEDVF